jgi:hypothetical protein
MQHELDRLGRREPFAVLRRFGTPPRDGGRVPDGQPADAPLRVAGL